MLCSGYSSSFGRGKNNLESTSLPAIYKLLNMFPRGVYISSNTDIPHSFKGKWWEGPKIKTLLYFYGLIFMYDQAAVGPEYVKPACGHIKALRLVVGVGSVLVALSR